MKYESNYVKTAIELKLINMIILVLFIYLVFFIYIIRGISICVPNIESLKSILLNLKK